MTFCVLQTTAEKVGGGTECVNWKSKHQLTHQGASYIYVSLDGRLVALLMLRSCDAGDVIGDVTLSHAAAAVL